MYAALDNTGKLINALVAKRDNNYYCCECKQRVKLITTRSSSYFRHKNKCNNKINERLIHQDGKQLIINQLSKWKYHSLKSEFYLPTIKQRPDILVNENLAIEYQCAQISVDILAKRVNGYRLAGIKNVWILGGHYLNKLGREHLKFIAYNKSWQFYLLTLDSQRKILTLFYDIGFVGPFNALTYQEKVFEDSKFHELLMFRPKRHDRSRLVINDYWLKKIRKKDDPISQKFKLDFYITHKMTVEDYLRNNCFEKEFPIFANQAWQRYCGQIPKRLNQPLLKK